jgi:uncharacterized repeat protein (TIGR02059 family)
MRYFLSVLLLLIPVLSSAQTVLTIEGKTYTNSDETWIGVNIPRSTPTTLIFRNNTITSSNLYGYMLQAGDEVAGVNNNNLDGAVITGNKFTWTGSDKTSITHGLFTGHNIDVSIRYNYLDHVPMGIIRKSTTNMTNNSGGVAYNIIRSTNVGIVVKGMSGVLICNNTLYQDRTTSETARGLIDVYTNADVTPNSVSHGTVIHNNIFYTKYETVSINIMDQESLTGLVSDYNVFYCETGSPKFRVSGSLKTFAEWQAMGYDKHSVVINPEFTDFINFVPKKRLDYGVDLGSAWLAGLSVAAKWGAGDPQTTLQNGKWQVGAVIYEEMTTDPGTVPVYAGSEINNATPSRIEMTYTIPLANITPATSAFSVKVNSVSRTISSVSVSGTKVYLNLSGPVAHGDVVTIAYSIPASNPLQSAGGVLAGSLPAQSVTNNISVPANLSPVIEISSPTKSTAFIAPATITIDAAASDPDGMISKVEFYNGSTKLGERTTAPWSFTWKEVPAGTYTITAAATDNSNSRVISQPVTVVVEKAVVAVNQLPTVVISSVVDNDYFRAPATITLSASATDPDGSVIMVEYFNGTEKLGESTTPPFSFSFECDSAATFEITAVASDNLFATSTSAPVTISVVFKQQYPDLINIYPNPNDGHFTVEMDLLPDHIEMATLTILDLSGRTLYSDQLSASEINRYIDVSNSLPGNYIIRLSDHNKILTTKRFIKY